MADGIALEVSRVVVGPLEPQTGVRACVDVGLDLFLKGELAHVQARFGSVGIGYQGRLYGLLTFDAVPAVGVVLAEGLDALVDGLAETCRLIGHEGTVHFARLVDQASESGVSRLTVPLVVHVEAVLDFDSLRVDAGAFDLLAEVASLLGNYPRIVSDQILIVLIVLHLRSPVLLAEGTVEILGIVVIFLSPREMVVVFPESVEIVLV